MKGFGKWEKISATGPFQSAKVPTLRRDITAVGWLCLADYVDKPRVAGLDEERQCWVII